MRQSQALLGLELQGPWAAKILPDVQANLQVGVYGHNAQVLDVLKSLAYRKHLTVQVFLFLLQGVGFEEHRQAQSVLRDMEQATLASHLVPQQAELTGPAMATASLLTTVDRTMMKVELVASLQPMHATMQMEVRS
tara:strand:- start:53 stop:460 length:408 start_codon:yes stop_codon:yes gene_type:complete